VRRAGRVERPFGALILRWELHDVVADVSQEHDLAAERPALALELARHLIAALDQADAQPPLPTEDGTPAPPDPAALERAAR